MALVDHLLTLTLTLAPAPPSPAPSSPSPSPSPPSYHRHHPRSPSTSTSTSTSTSRAPFCTPPVPLDLCSHSHLAALAALAHATTFIVLVLATAITGRLHRGRLRLSPAYRHRWRRLVRYSRAARRARHLLMCAPPAGATSTRSLTASRAPMTVRHRSHRRSAIARATARLTARATHAPLRAFVCPPHRAARGSLCHQSLAPRARHTARTIARTIAPPRRHSHHRGRMRVCVLSHS